MRRTIKLKRHYMEYIHRTETYEVPIWWVRFLKFVFKEQWANFKWELQEALEDVAEETPTQETSQTTIDYVDPRISSENLEEYEARVQQATQEPEMVVSRSAPIHINDIRTSLHQTRDKDFEINPELQKIRSSSTLEQDYVVESSKLDKDAGALPFEEKERKYKGRPI